MGTFVPSFDVASSRVTIVSLKFARRHRLAAPRASTFFDFAS